MKILHVMNEDPKFPAWFFDFLLENGLLDLPGTRHGFLCKKGGVFDTHVKQAAAAGIGSRFSLDYFPDRRGPFHKLRSARRIAALSPGFDKILFHWLDDRALLSLAYGEVAGKSAWSLWGGDLYGFRTKKNHTGKDTLSEFLKRCLVRRLGQVCSLVREDTELAAEWYGASAKWSQVFYPSEAYKTVPPGPRARKEGGSLSVQVGNSANPTNRHLEVFEALSKVDGIERVICPLSYGDRDYAKKVAEAGTRLFGAKFLPLTDFIAPPEYAALLSSVDAAVDEPRPPAGRRQHRAQFAARQPGVPAKDRDDLRVFQEPRGGRVSHRGPAGRPRLRPAGPDGCGPAEIRTRRPVVLFRRTLQGPLARGVPARLNRLPG